MPPDHHNPTFKTCFDTFWTLLKKSKIFENFQFFGRRPPPPSPGGEIAVGRIVPKTPQKCTFFDLFFAKMKAKQLRLIRLFRGPVQKKIRDVLALVLTS